MAKCLLLTGNSSLLQMPHYLLLYPAHTQAIPDTVDTVPDTVYERPPPSESQASTNIPQSSHPISAGLQSGSNIPPSSSEEEMATAAVGSEEEPSATGEGKGGWYL